MKKPRRYLLWVTGVILSVFLLLNIVAFFLFANKKNLIHDLAIAQINSRVKGDATIGSITPTFFKNFPNISICFKDMTIRDSLWEIHQKDFFKAEKTYITLNWLSLLKGRPQVKQVIIENGYIHLYTDVCGYCNLNRKENDAPKKEKGAMPGFTLKNTRVIIENELRNAYHDFDFRHFHSRVIKKDSTYQINIAMKSLVHGIGFNLEKGTYLTEKTMDGTASLTYTPGSMMDLTDVDLSIQHQPFSFSGAFHFDSDTSWYDLQIGTQSILYKDASSLLTQNIQRSLNLITIDQPIDASAHIIGKMAPKVVPLINTAFVVKDAIMQTPIGEVKQTSYSGTFNNHINADSLPGDANTKITLNDLSTNWSGIKLTSKKTEITNLLHPLLYCDVQSTFELTAINEIASSSTIQFLQGQGKLDVIFNAPMSNQDTILPGIQGGLTIANAELKYLPRNLVFKDCSGALEFKNKDLLINKVLGTVGTSQLSMQGLITNFLSLLNQQPDKLTIEWAVSTPSLNLGDFTSYVGQSKYAAKEKPKEINNINNTVSNVNRMLLDATVKLNIKAERFLYKKFKASDVAATLHFIKNEVLLRNGRIHHSGGLMVLEGLLINGPKSNFLKIQTNIDNADIPELFAAFDNFGQDAITSKNMKGKFSGKINMEGLLTDKIQVQENSMRGKIDFSIKNGELNNFEPLMKISTTALKNRDFSQIRFTELSNQINIVGTSIYFPRMEIRSNVVVLFVEGTYDTKKGTDMSIQIPLSNLSKAENELMQNTGKAGVNIRLRAKTESDGSLKISWDPLNNASKKRKAEMEKDSIMIPENQLKQ